jgi:hypothetical protein
MFNKRLNQRVQHHVILMKPFQLFSLLFYAVMNAAFVFADAKVHCLLRKK